MKQLKHFDFFKSLLEKQENELIELAIENGRIPIGYTCSFIPRAALMVDKLFPIRLRAQEVDDIEEASFYLSNMLCSYSRSVLQSTFDGNYDFLVAQMGTTSCGHMCGAVECSEWKKVLGNDTLYPIIDIPKSKDHMHPIEGEKIQYIEKLYKPIDEKYGLDYSDEAFLKAIEQFNQYAEIMQKISDLRKLDAPKISGYEYHVIYTASTQVPVDMILDKLEETYEELSSREGITDYRAKIMILGSELDDPDFTKIIEEEGGLVVADRYCTGSLPDCTIVKLDSNDDPLLNLLKFQIKMQPCPKIVGGTFDRMDYTFKLIDEFNVDGVLYERMKFCEYWAYESVTVHELFTEKNVPHVIIEREYQLSAAGQIRTRIQAFLESLEIKRINNKLNKMEG